MRASGGRAGPAAAVDAEDLAEVGDHDVLGDVQADDPSRGADPEQPEFSATQATRPSMPAMLS